MANILGRTNAAFELVSSLRQARLAGAKRAIEQQIQAAESVDDRRKLATSRPQPVSGATTVTRRYFTPGEISELAGVLSELANSNSELAIALAMDAQEFVPKDHRGYGFWDYLAINLYKAGRHSDAYLTWQKAVTAAEAVEEKKSDEKKTEKKTEEKKTEEPKKGELPARPRARRRKNDADEKDEKKEEKKEEIAESEGKMVETFVKSDHGNLSHVFFNMRFPLEKLRCRPVTADQLPTVDKLFQVLHRTGWTSQSIPSRFHAFNPSIIPHPNDPKNKFLVNLRAGNYFMNALHKYEFPPGMPGITTLNFLGTIDQDFRGEEFGDTKQLKAPPMPNPYPDINGMEDMRLLWEPESKKLYASFTSLEVTPEHRPQMCLCQIDMRKGRIVGNPVRLHGFESDRSQKNWAAFADGGKLYFVYSFQPLTVLQANPRSGEVKVVSVDCCPVLNNFRGSSPLVDLPDELVARLPMSGKVYTPEERAEDAKRGVRWFIAVVHVSNFPRYYHQVAIVRKTPCHGSEFRPFTLAVTHTCPPFVFDDWDVEFAAGLAFTSDLAEVVLPFSKRDNNLTCVRLSTDSVIKQLFPVPIASDFRLGN